MQNYYDGKDCKRVLPAEELNALDAPTEEDFVKEKAQIEDCKSFIDEAKKKLTSSINDLVIAGYPDKQIIDHAFDSMEASYEKLHISYAERVKSSEPTVKQLLYSLVGYNGFMKCEIWKHMDYIRANSHSKSYRRDLISGLSKEELIARGLSEKTAERMISKTYIPLNKKNLALLGKPIAVGTIGSLSNRIDLYNFPVRKVMIEGIIRKKVIILLEK